MRYLVPMIALPYALGCALVWAVQPIFGPALLAAPAIAFLLWQSLEWTLIAICFCIPFDRALIVSPEGGLTVTKLLIVMLIGLWTIRVFVTKDTYVAKSFFSRATTILLVMHTFMAVISLANAHNLEYPLYFGMKQINLLIFYFLIVTIIRDMTLLNRAINALLIASFFVCMIGMYEFVSGDQFLPSTNQGGTELAMTFEGSSRIQGCAGHSNFHSAILVMLLPFLLSRFELTRSWFKWLMMGGLVFLYVINILGTNTRQGLLCMIVGFVGIYLFQEIRHRYAKLFGGLLLGLAIIGSLSTTMEDKVDVSRYEGESGLKSVEWRLGWIRMSFEMVRDHPFIGVGFGNYYAEYSHYRHTASTMASVERVVNHNGIMQTWAEMGTLGLLTFLALLASVPLTLWPLIRNPSPLPGVRSTAITLMIAMIVYILLIGIIPVLQHEVGWMIMAFSVVLRGIADRELVKQHTEAANALPA